MKKGIKLLFIFGFLFLLCGCSNELKSITGEEFLEPVSEKFNVSDISDRYSFADEAYYASYQTDKIIFYYVKGPKTFDIKSIFSDEVTNVLGSLSNTDNIKTKKGDNWEKLVTYDDSNYYYLIRVDGTYIYAKSTLDNKDEMLAILKKYDYK